jgi:L-iditol 2-dehydrogenase
MKALVYQGPMTMTVEEMPEPVPERGQVTVQVKAVGICGSDVHGFIGKTGRRKPPMIMGHEVTGVIARVGEGVTRFAPGDRVVINPVLSCSACRNCRAGRPNICFERHVLGVDLPGAYADYVQVAEQMIWPMPDTLSFEAGALVEPLAVALHAVNLTPIQLMDTVVVVGTGTIGLLTLMAAKLAGPGTVIVTDRSAHRLDVARRLGADATINVDQEQPLPIVQGLTGGAGADAVIEAVGYSATVQQALSLVRPGGHVTWIGNSQPNIEMNMQSVVTREVSVQGAYTFHDEFRQSVAAISSGRIKPQPLIEGTVNTLKDTLSVIRDLAEGKKDPVKVVFRPDR